MTEIDETIGQVSNLYRAVTGKDAPAGEAPYAPIPAEKDPHQHVQEQLERLTALLGTGHPASQALHPQASTAWSPSLAVWESSSEVALFIDLPGVTREQIELNVHGNILTVTGHRAAPVTNGHQLRASERPIGLFRRQIPLIPGLKTQELNAQLKDGVLELRIPREHNGAGQSRKIPIA